MHIHGTKNRDLHWNLFKPYYCKTVPTAANSCWQGWAHHYLSRSREEAAHPGLNPVAQECSCVLHHPSKGRTTMSKSLVRQEGITSVSAWKKLSAHIMAAQKPTLFHAVVRPLWQTSGTTLTSGHNLLDSESAVQQKVAMKTYLKTGLTSP